MYQMDKTSFTTSETNALEHVATAQTDRDTGVSVERRQQTQPSIHKSYAGPYSKASSDNTRKTMTNLMKVPHDLN